MSHPTGNSEHLRVQCAAGPDFVGWLAQSGGSLVVSTYQAGKVAMIGYDGRQATLLMRQFDKPLGVTVCGDLLALATRHDLTVFANAPLLAPEFLEDQPGRYDALYLPRASYHTGDLNVHDVAFAGTPEKGTGPVCAKRPEGRSGELDLSPFPAGELVFVNTRFSCLARVSHAHNFEPIWRPRFVSDLAPEDRCHLNGVAMVGGRPKYVTALGTTDEPGAWREKKATGGVVIDVASDEIVQGGMSMPHSPRWHEGRLWVLSSGTGELWVIDPESGQADVVCGLPGYLRGLSFVGPYALVGLCKIREKHIFGGLPIQERLAALRCGVAVIDTRTGALAGMFEFTAGCEEIYDVEFLPGVQRPMVLNLEKPAARQAVTHPETSWWLRASAEVSLVPTAPRLGPAGGAFDFLGNVLPDTGIQLEGK